MGKPTSDRGGIQQVIRALVADGWTLIAVGNGHDDEPVRTEREAIEAIEATGVNHLTVMRRGPEGTERGWVFFVLGNDPDEVVCDYTTNLTCVDTLTDSWV